MTLGFNPLPANTRICASPMPFIPATQINPINLGRIHFRTATIIVQNTMKRKTGKAVH